MFPWLQHISVILAYIKLFYFILSLPMMVTNVILAYLISLSNALLDTNKCCFILARAYRDANFVVLS